MAQVLKDFLTGSTIVLLGMFLSLAASIALLLFWIFFHVVGILAWLFFLVFVILFAVWLIGFLYRKIREMKKK